FFQRLLDNARDDPLTRMETAWAFEDLGSGYYWGIADYAAGEKRLRNALALYEDLVREFPDDSTYNWLCARCLEHLGCTLHMLGQPDSAQAAWSRSAEQYRIRLALAPDWRAHIDLANSLLNYPEAEHFNPAEAVLLARLGLGLARENVDKYAEAQA